MDADQLRDLARRAANRTGYRQILVLGSQAVHGASNLTVAVTGGFGRRSDRAFVEALANEGHLDLDVLEERIDRLPNSVPERVRRRADSTVQGLR